MNFFKEKKYNLYIEKVQNFFDEQAYRLSENKLYRVRFICTLICLDFLALVSLSGSSLVHFLSPLKFLEKPAVDKRDTLLLYYISADGFEASYEQKRNLVPVQRKVYQIKEGHPQHILKENARLIIQELNHEPESLKAKEVITESDLIKYIWIQGKTLIIQFNKLKWRKIPAKDRYLVQNSIQKSILENLDIQKVIWARES